MKALVLVGGGVQNDLFAQGSKSLALPSFFLVFVGGHARLS